MQGSVTQAVLYAPHGQVISEYREDWKLDTLPRYLFSAKELDEESKMYYFKARFQDPNMGIFISPDPLYYKRPWMSKYAYYSNNPINRIDPTGLFDSPSEAEKSRKDAVKRYGKKNVGRVYLNEKTGQYGYRISKTGFRTYSKEDARKRGADAYADGGKGIFNNRDLTNYNNSNGLSKQGGIISFRLPEAPPALTLVLSGLNVVNWSIAMKNAKYLKTYEPRVNGFLTFVNVALDAPTAINATNDWQNGDMSSSEYSFVCLKLLLPYVAAAAGAPASFVTSCYLQAIDVMAKKGSEESVQMDNYIKDINGFAKDYWYPY